MHLQMKEEKETNNKEVDSLELTANSKLFLAMGGKMMFGTLAGYISGRFVKQLTDWAIFHAGIGIFFIGGLHYMQWITINWGQIDGDLLNIYNRARTSAKDKGFVARLKRMFVRTLPLLAGFATGFKAAFHFHED